MRLLSTTAIQVDEIWTDNIPPYAILSHTYSWDADEIELQDIEALHGYWESAAGGTSIPMPKRKSFEKLRRAARTARQHGYKYIWVDTCCIDRSNKEEVSEAVNNTYGWYENAAVCYAYLSDVDPSDSEDVYSAKSSFRRSRWFSRGWTLHELIAPSKMEFYARDWSHLGSKKDSDDDFTCLLAAITDIDAEVLAGECDLDDVSISTRMQWAARRETSCIEDIGYCLLGIFGIQMSINYGEGANAFLRLQQELLPKTHDQTLFAWYIDDDTPSASSSSSSSRSRGASPSPSPSPSGEMKMWGLLADSPRRFVGSGDLTPIVTTAIADIPLGMTGKGLRVGFTIRPCQEFGFSTDIYQARLSCDVAATANNAKPPVIFLKRLWGDQFARVLADKRLLSSQKTPESDEGTFDMVFVKQQPSHSVRHIRITVADQLPAPGIIDRTPIAWEVVSAYPEDYWDKKVALKTPGFQTGIVGVFRVQIKIPRANYIVDVAVGMIHDQRSCRSWCQQYKVTDEEWTPEDTYEQIDEMLDGGELTVTNNSTQDCDGNYLAATFSSSERNGYRSLDVTLRISRSWYGSVKPGLRPILKKLNKLQPTVEDGPSGHHLDDEPIPGLRNRAMTDTDLAPIGIVSEDELAACTHDDITGFEPQRRSKRNSDPGVHFGVGFRGHQSSGIQPRVGKYEKTAASDRQRLSGQPEQDDEDDDSADEDDYGISDGSYSPVERTANNDISARATRLISKIKDLQDSCKNLMMLGTRRKIPEEQYCQGAKLVDAMLLHGHHGNRSSSTLGNPGRLSTDDVGGGDEGEWHGVCPLHYSGCSCRKSLSISRRGSHSSSRVSVGGDKRRSWAA